MGMAMQSILAVDDSVSMRRLIAWTLRSAGYHVIEAADGADALAQAGAKDVDLVITDQNMPGMDGLALTRSLRADARLRDVPVLILSTDDDPDLKQAARSAGATGWLTKPFEPQRLLEVIRKVAPPPETKPC
jgi:two-component system chemotaxis response regulator CheY